MQREKELVERAKKGEPGAFELLYESYFDRIYRYVVLKVAIRADAEDLTQQVFVRALESIGSFRWRGVPFASWLYRIAHNQVVDYYRKKGREKTAPLDEARTLSIMDPVDIAEQRMNMEQLATACAQLSDSQKEVISLRFAGGLSVAETARTMGKSEGATKVLQHEALKRLRRILSSMIGEGDGCGV